MALLPLAAIAVVIQTNPYQALILRGILGAIAALVYAVFGAADVALTEALVGTMLAMTLYAIAVRSSMVMRMGIEQSKAEESDRLEQQLLVDLRQILQRYHLRLDLVNYPERAALDQALLDKEIHTICTVRSPSPTQPPETEELLPTYHLITRIQRLYTLLQDEFAASTTTIAYASLPQNLSQKSLDNIPENVPKNIEESSP
jgi:putative multicomponent Na+:H+ antiporter subunit B